LDEPESVYNTIEPEGAPTEKPEKEVSRPDALINNSSSAAVVETLPAIDLVKENHENMFTWEMPAVRQLSEKRYMAMLSFTASEEDVLRLLKEYPNMNLQPFRLDFDKQTYTLQNEFPNKQLAQEFLANVIAIFKKIQK